MRQQAITLETFVQLVGCMDVEMLRRHSNGSTWLLADGRMVAELKRGDTWTWVLSEDSDGGM